MNTFKRAVLTIAGVAMTVGFAAPADACETDEDCGPGHVCESYEYTTPACDVKDMDCEEGDDACLEEMEMMQEECDGEPETITRSYCTRAPCETDDDCGDVMVCNEHVEEWCTATSEAICDENGCEETEWVEECGTEIYKECGYMYEGNCEEDADCGEGWNCVPDERCSCTGFDRDEDDMPATPPDLDAEPDEDVEMPEEDIGEAVGEEEDYDGEEDYDEDITCTCEPTGTNSCQLQEIDCETDADCPVGMVCGPEWAMAACEVTEDGQENCEIIETGARCEPENWAHGDWDEAEDGAGDYDGVDAGSTGESKDDDDDDGDYDEEVEEDDPAPSDQNTGNSDAEEDDEDGRNKGKGRGWKPFSPWGWGAWGCSVAAPASGNMSGAGILSLLGLLAFAIRRRRH